LEVKPAVNLRLKDAITVTDCLDAVQSAYQQVSSVQGNTPAQQAAGAALLFYVIATEAGLDISELVNQCQRMQKDATQDAYRKVEMSALRAYVKGELKK
jgi:hypothetical protein